MKKQEKKKQEKKLRSIWYITDFFCDNKLILQCGGTKKKIFVETWSGNHPIFSLKKKNDNDDDFFF